MIPVFVQAGMFDFFNNLFKPSQSQNVGAAIFKVEQGGTGIGTYDRGDLIMASSSSLLFRLATGTEGYVLTITSGIPGWAASAGGGAGIDTWDITGVTMTATNTVKQITVSLASTTLATTTISTLTMTSASTTNLSITGLANGFLTVDGGGNISTSTIGIVNIIGLSGNYVASTTLTNNYYGTTTISNNYLATGTAASTYLTITSAATNYVSTTTLLSYPTSVFVGANYVSTTTGLTYLTTASAATNYVSTTTGLTYLTTTTAASTYLATGTAASTYFTIAGANASNTSWLADTDSWPASSTNWADWNSAYTYRVTGTSTSGVTLSANQIGLNGNVVMGTSTAGLNILSNSIGLNLGTSTAGVNVSANVIGLNGNLSSIAVISTTTGNLIVASSTNGWGALTVGTSGYCLQASSSQPYGLAWASCAAATAGVSSLNGITGVTLIAGTANQITVASSSQTITLSTPQNIGTASSPTFANLTITTNATASSIYLSAGITAATATITTITGALVGNAGTATALASNPADCGAGTVARSIDASGNLTCSAVDISADTNLAAGRSLTMSGDSVELDAEIYTKTVNMAFFNVTTTASGNKSLYWFPGQAITITEIGCIDDGTSVTLSFGEAAESSLSTSTSIIGTIVCDADSASTTSFVDAAIGPRSRVKGTVTAFTAATNTWATIFYTIND